jgi:hypothetical protein
VIPFIEPPFAARIREQQSPEHRAAARAFEESRYAPDKLPRDFEGRPYDPREVLANAAGPLGGPCFDFTEVRGYTPDGRPIVKDDWNAIHRWMDERRAAATIAAVPVATFFENRPTNDVAREIAEHQRQRHEAAMLRQQVANGQLAHPAPYDISRSVAPASGDDDGW